jgi:signal transduction histidine kinase/ActR/RegA family two-component response regulator
MPILITDTARNACPCWIAVRVLPGPSKTSLIVIDTPVRFASRPLLIAVLLWLGLAGATSLVLWQMRQDALQSQTRELGLMSLALSDEIGRGLRGAQDGLQAMRAELREERLPTEGNQSGKALQTRAALMPLVSSLWLVDHFGHLLAASDATPVPGSERFRPSLSQLPSDGIAISEPFTDPKNSESLVALAVRFENAQGGGWILAGVPANALLGAFVAASPATDASMAVFRADGARLASANLAGTRSQPVDIAQLLTKADGQGTFAVVDGRKCLVALRTLAGFELKVLMARDLDALLAAWRRTAQLAAAALVVMLLMMLIAIHLILQADRRRSAAQQALQAQLSRASKLESLGTLAGGVAHDFNNLLAGIIGFAEMAQDEAPPGTDQARHLAKVLQVAMRGKSLVERILAFSRGGARRTLVFELEPVVQEVLTLLSASLRADIVLERALSAPGGRLRGDPTQTFEAVMNLCTNAMQAMPQGGMLSVQVHRQRVIAPQVLSHSRLAPGDYLMVTVADQGTGVSAQAMERLFEPFFTTRAAQAGTGLGLAVVHGVVAEFGGGIDVNSSPGAGARFSLYLPECKEAVDVALQAHDGAVRGSGQRLMVVDDHPELVQLTAALLNSLGYQATSFSDPGEALEVLRADPQRYAAVVTDEVMPGLTGTQLTAALRAFAPNLPVLLVSAYGGALLAQRAAQAGVTRVLAKPLQRVEFARALADLDLAPAVAQD